MFQYAPYVEIKLEIATAYIHVPAFHAWLFWRGFVLQPSTNSFVRSFFGPRLGKGHFRPGSPEAEQLKQLEFEIMWCVRVFVFLRVELKSSTTLQVGVFRTVSALGVV